MESSLKRIKNDIEHITKITATPENGCTRFSYSHEDAQAREYLINEMKNLGLTINIDGVGNIRAKYIGNNIDCPSIMIGSHIDTVFNGGKFDGLTGVVAALEVVRVIKENKVKLTNPIEIIIFAEEEGSNFNITMLGSKALIGSIDADYLKNIYNDDGLSGYKIMKDFGLDVDNISNEALRKGEVKAMIELHVEQGGILDSEKISIGIVRAIAGMRTYKICLKGVSNHAGSTPMDYRKDPMVGAAEIISYLNKMANREDLINTVATVGKIFCHPNVSNVISEMIEFYVDIRDVDVKGIEIIEEELKNKTKEVAEKHELIFTIDLVATSDSVNLSQDVIDEIKNVAEERGYNYKIMNSGAVHDSAMLTNLTNVGMIFVPSINGRSHCPEELTNYKDIKLGCDLLLGTVIKLAI